MEQDFANTAYRIQGLLNKGFSVRFIRDKSGRVAASCDTHKVRVSYGDTMAEALALLELRLVQSGWLKGAVL